MSLHVGLGGAGMTGLDHSSRLTPALAGVDVTDIDANRVRAAAPQGADVVATSLQAAVSGGRKITMWRPALSAAAVAAA